MADKKLYVIIRHDEGDNIHRPYYWVDNEADAIAAVKQLNTTESQYVTLNTDGSMADICTDEAIWYDYDDVKPFI